ncbi:MAG TPA: PIN domain-containing protein [Chloroflexota bacterium]|nr:PIN domain-containing protein [Chloroflexota bacterium]
MTAEFCDTNILVYAYDVTAGVKREQAEALLARLWTSDDGVVSVQVLQELFVALTRKIPRPLTAVDARLIVSDMTAWRVVEPNSRDVLDAIDGADRWRVSFWDAMIVTAASRAGARIVWSEDLNAGQSYGDVTVYNPFSLPNHSSSAPE